MVVVVAVVVGLVCVRCMIHYLPRCGSSRCEVKAGGQGERVGWLWLEDCKVGFGV